MKKENVAGSDREPHIEVPRIAAPADRNEAYFFGRCQERNIEEAIRGASVGSDHFFIQVFTHEAGMIDRESIIKKVTDLNTKTDDVLSWLQKGLDLPFRPPIEEEAKAEAEQTDISELADRFEAA